MHIFRRVLIDGLRSSLRLPLLLPLYLASLLLGLAQTWPLLAIGGSGLSNPFLGRLAVGNADTLVDLLFGLPSAAASTGLWAILLLIVAVILGLLYNFFSGGVLHVYAAKLPFWTGCRRTFWTFTGLALMLYPIAGAGILTAALLYGFVGITGSLIVGVVWLQLANLAGEYARALAVTADRRNPFVLLGMALGFCARRLPGVLLFGLLGLLLHVALGGMYRAVAGLLGASPVAVLWQQLVLFAWIWIKFLRLAWAVGYTEGAGSRGRPPSGADLLATSAHSDHSESSDN